jgi:hypothetical protein
VGSEGEMGWDNGEGAMRRFGSGAFVAGAAVVAGAARVGVDSWRDYDRLERYTR